MTLSGHNIGRTAVGDSPSHDKVRLFSKEKRRKKMKLPLQSAPVERGRRLHPYKGIEPDENGVYPAELLAQQYEDEEEDEGEEGGE